MPFLLISGKVMKDGAHDMTKHTDLAFFSYQFLRCRSCPVWLQPPSEKHNMRGEKHEGKGMERKTRITHTSAV